MNLKQLQAAVMNGQRFEYLMFWGHRDRGGPLGPTCLSQWYRAPFTADGCRYATAEHYMMAGKARLFGDQEMLEQILDTDDPGRAKALGRKVRGFDHATWELHRSEIVTRGNVAKFSSTPRLRSYLLGTGDKVLVEASPYDRIWGIGLAAADESARDPLEWQGLNLLGFALMEARDRLREEG